MMPREREIPIDSGHSRGHDHESQPPAPATGLAETSRQLEEAAKRHRDLAARLTERHGMTIPAEDPVHDISPAFPLTSAQRRTAILQPPKPEIPPSSWVLERVADRDRTWKPPTNAIAGLASATGNQRDGPLPAPTTDRALHAGGRRKS